MATTKAPESKTPVIQIVSPRTIPGILTTNNKGAIDWGWQSFVAYGCFNHVIIIDTQNIKVFQTLQKHKGEVIKVKWSKESFYHDMSNPYTLKLASSDNMGCIVIWDVKMAKATAVLSEGSKPVADMEWVSAKDACQNLLVALQPPYSVILWNTESGAKIWKKSYTETLISFAFDPFMDNNMTFLASKCILFIDDFSTSKVPSSNGRKFYISNPSSAGSHHSANSVGNNISNDDRPKSTSRSILPRRMRFLVKADSKSSNTDDGVTLNECLQLSYHRSYRHHLLLLYPREVLILDLEINQTVGIVSADHNGSPMMQLYSCWQRDVFFILHENGSVSFRLRHRGHVVMAAATPSEAGDYAPNSHDSNLEVTYDLHCQSDALRLTKHGKIIGMSICPISETKVALLVSDGRLLFFELLISQKKHISCCFPPYLSDIFETQEVSESLCENFSEKSCFLLPFPCKAVHPSSVLSDHFSPALYSHHQMYRNVRDAMKFKLFITGVTSVLAAPPHVIRMCPPVTFRNWTMYQPLMAVGNGCGSIQVVNMATGIIEKEFSVHTSPVRGIEWIGLTSFLSYAHPNTISILGHVRNELVITDVQSGRTCSLRTDSSEESPIEMLRVSYSRQYAIIVFKEEPFELWDLRSLTLLKIMPKNFPSVSALEWYPRPLKKVRSSLDFSTKMKDNSSNFDQNPENEMTSKPFTYPKENFIFTDTNGQLYSFSVEGNLVTDGHPVPADIAMGSTTCIAWKGNYIVLGDVDGNLVIYNDEGSNPKTIPTLRGWIKKIRFGPGKGNTKILVLYSDGVDLWDAKNGMIIHQIHCPREMPKVQDIDWAATDRPALATSDGCIRITDIPLKFCSSSLEDYEPSDCPFSPHILSSEMGLFLKSFLLHQLGKQKFSFSFEKQNNHDVTLAENQLKSLCPEVRSFLKASPPFGIAERCLHVSRIFGDEEGLRFWTVALHFLKQAKLESAKGETKENYIDTGNFDARGDSPCEKRNLEVFFDQPLDTGYDVYCDNETYKRLQIDRVSLHVYKRTTHNQTQQCAEHLLLLGQTDKAVQLLLETEAINENFYVDSLRACLIATVQSSGTSQSIIKLVSTNLIVNGHIMEGVQLLCLIDKGVDACRYLQGSGRWDQAVWLAKSTLPQNECQEILKRWVDHLCSPVVNQKYKGILILLSMQQFWKIVQLLHSFHMVERAALFLQACLEFGVITRNKENISTIDEIFSDYAKYLLSIKNRDVAIEFYKHVSDKSLELGI